MENRTDITNSYKENLLFKNNDSDERIKYKKENNKKVEQNVVVNKIKK